MLEMVLWVGKQHEAFRNHHVIWVAVHDQSLAEASYMKHTLRRLVADLATSTDGIKTFLFYAEAGQVQGWPTSAPGFWLQVFLVFAIMIVTRGRKVIVGVDTDVRCMVNFNILDVILMLRGKHYLKPRPPPPGLIFCGDPGLSINAGVWIYTPHDLDRILRRTPVNLEDNGGLPAEEEDATVVTHLVAIPVRLQRG